MPALIQDLFDGSLDIIGDIHGEIDALRVLLDHLGYVNGEHPQGRRLVFVGDLCDRGPDSVAVIELVADLVERGLAQCIAGNHEMNVLREDPKAGNRWILDPEHAENTLEYPSRLATAADREAIAAMFRTLPLALERSDLRVVHAMWHAPSIEALRGTMHPSIDVFRHHEDAMKRTLEETGLRQAAKAELEAHKHGLHDRGYAMPLLSLVGRCEEKRQTLNPVRVVTSGAERATEKQFFATGKWRFCDRVAWWSEYTDDSAVIFGHYWRGMREEGKPAMFGDATPADWLGPRRNVYCADFSVGRRYHERKARPGEPFVGRLAAVRWPERTVVFDDGEAIESR